MYNTCYYWLERFAAFGKPKQTHGKIGDKRCTPSKHEHLCVHKCQLKRFSLFIQQTLTNGTALN